MKYFFLIVILLAVLVATIAGTRGHFFQQPPLEIFPDMDRQLKMKEQRPGAFFADGRSARPPVPGTVPLGYTIPAGTAPVSPADLAGGIRDPYGDFSRGGDYLNTGRFGDYWGDGIPLPVTVDVIERGRERYEINCAICHAATGMGNGAVAKYWQGAPVASLQDKRIIEMPDGQIFHTIAHGKGVAPNWTMFPYGDKITVEDRWAIVAYLRTLQRGLHATLDDVPPEHRSRMETQEAPK